MSAGVTDHRSVLTEISNEMVRPYKQKFGRGPTAVRSYWPAPTSSSRCSRTP